MDTVRIESDEAEQQEKALADWLGKRFLLSCSRIAFQPTVNSPQ